MNTCKLYPTRVISFEASFPKRVSTLMRIEELGVWSWKHGRKTYVRPSQYICDINSVDLLIAFNQKAVAIQSSSWFDMLYNPPTPSLLFLIQSLYIYIHPPYCVPSAQNHGIAGKLARTPPQPHDPAILPRISSNLHFSHLQDSHCTRIVIPRFIYIDH